MESGNKLVYLHFESFEKYSIKVFTKNIPIKYFGGILWRKSSTIFLKQLLMHYVITLNVRINPTASNGTWSHFLPNLSTSEFSCVAIWGDKCSNITSAELFASRLSYPKVGGY